MKWKEPLAWVILMPVFFSHVQETSINEKKHILAGGIEQWITIKGKDRSNPVVLFVHGNPGSPISTFSETIFGMEKRLHPGQLDQRDAGRPFGRKALEEVDEEYLQANPLSP